MIWRIGEFFCPHSCLCCGKTGGILCECCEKYIINAENVGCLKCGGMLHDGVCSVCALPFRRQLCLGARDGLLKQLVSLYKCIQEDVVLVPLPTIRKHIRERGFDHVYDIACWLAGAYGCRVEKALIRANNTVQVGADAKKRVEQARTAYAARNVNASKKYILLDDVWTTGSSMLAACNEMQKAGAKNISVIVLTKSG